MNGAITDVHGILVGHAQDTFAATGCTVILCESGTASGVDVRGGSPGTRETDCLAPTAAMPCPHAFYLCGGSAFGLDGASGVQKCLEAKGIGFDTGVARVPIVSGAVLFDLHVGRADRRPDQEMGMEACRKAGVEVRQGNVGAGTGATSGWAAGPSRRMKTGLGTASLRTGDLVVGAIVAVNAWGDIVDPATGDILAGTLNEAGNGFAGSQKLLIASPKGINPFATHSTIGVVASNARLDKAQASRVAMMAHDGYARAIVPVHTLGEGDIIFSVVTGAVEASVSVVGAMAAEAMVQAILNAVRTADSAYGHPGYEEVRARRRTAAREAAVGAKPAG